MEEDVKHSHLVGKESGTSPEAGKGSSSHNTPSQGKDPTPERESSATEHKGHHQHQHPPSTTFFFPTRNNYCFFLDNCNDKL
jgi:hypothetical protein